MFWSSDRGDNLVASSCSCIHIQLLSVEKPHRSARDRNFMDTRVDGYFVRAGLNFKPIHTFDRDSNEIPWN
jgi:hypothetical protein